MNTDDISQLQPIFEEELDDKPDIGSAAVYLLVNSALLRANPEAVARIAEEHLVRLRTGDYVSQNNQDATWRWEQIASLAADATLSLLQSSGPCVSDSELHQSVSRLQVELLEARAAVERLHADCIVKDKEIVKLKDIHSHLRIELRDMYERLRILEEDGYL